MSSQQEFGTGLDFDSQIARCVDLAFNMFNTLVSHSHTFLMGGISLRRR